MDKGRHGALPCDVRFKAHFPAALFAVRNKLHFLDEELLNYGLGGLCLSELSWKE